MTTGHDRRADGRDFRRTAARVLQHLHATVGLDMWAMGRRQGDDWVVLSSAGADLDGLALAWEDTLCIRIQAGQAQWCTPEVDAVPCLVQARELVGLPIASFVTVPLHDEEGTLLGTLCGAGTTPAAPELAQCRPQLEAFADVLSSLLAVELQLEREAREREVAESDARTDALTGLGNRRRWDQHLLAEEERCRRYGSTAGVLTVDVDGLKEVNDRWGHDAGDALLRQVADVLRHECRPGDVVARLGGDEFGVLLAEVGTAEAEAVAERLQEALVTAHAPASVGLAVRGRGGLVEAWRDADARMYEQKRAATRGEPVRPPQAVPAPDPGRDAVVRELLALVQGQTGADAVLVWRAEPGRRVLRAAHAAAALPFGPGHVEALDGRSGGDDLSVPLRLPGGEDYGWLSCVSSDDRPLEGATRRLVEQVAERLAAVLGAEEQERAGRRRVLAAIDGLLATEALHMTYQPVVDLRSGRVRGVEALARFADGRSPAAWFEDAALVERTAELELLTARTAVQECAGWDGELWLNLSASVLVSPAACSLLDDRDLSRVLLEVSDHEQVDDYAGLRRALAPWRERGLRLAVDDAGAGSTSLRHALELQPEVLKLDTRLVRGLVADPAVRAVVDVLVSFAAQSGADLVAEGVESAAELAAVTAAGVRFGQGYHLGVPVPLAELPRRTAAGLVPAPRSTEVPAAS